MFLSKLRKAVLPSCGALALMLAFEGQAQAAYSFHDTIETPAWWSFDGDGSYTGYFSTSQYYSYNHSIRLSADAGSWSTAATSVPLSSFFPCVASFEVRALDAQTVAIEVINPTNWTYIDYSSFYIDSAHRNTWVYIEGNSWSAASYSNVVVRATVSSASGTRRAYFDELWVDCGF